MLQCSIELKLTRDTQKTMEVHKGVLFTLNVEFLWNDDVWKRQFFKCKWSFRQIKFYEKVVDNDNWTWQANVDTDGAGGGDGW